MKTLTMEENPENPGLKLSLLDDGRYEITGFPDDPLVIPMGPGGISEQALLAIIANRRGGVVAVHTLDEKPTGIEMMWLERRRQIEVLGCSAAHDDGHSDGEILQAAWDYLEFALRQIQGDETGSAEDAPDGWPFEASEWKPSNDPMRNLEKAGAMIAAEWDRLKRKQNADAALCAQAAGATGADEFAGHPIIQKALAEVQAEIPLPPPTSEDVAGIVMATLGEDTPAEMIAGWTDEQKQQVIDYCGAVHFAASDNPVKVPPRPSFFPEHRAPSAQNTGTLMDVTPGSAQPANETVSPLIETESAENETAPPANETDATNGANGAPEGGAA